MTARERLENLWDLLESRYGATVDRVDLDGLAESRIGALAEQEERRLRALDEGDRAGWRPPIEGAA